MRVSVLFSSMTAMASLAQAAPGTRHHPDHRHHTHGQHMEPRQEPMHPRERVRHSLSFGRFPNTTVDHAPATSPADVPTGPVVVVVCPSKVVTSTTTLEVTVYLTKADGLPTISTTVAHDGRTSGHAHSAVPAAARPTGPSTLWVDAPLYPVNSTRFRDDASRKLEHGMAFNVNCTTDP